MKYIETVQGLTDYEFSGVIEEIKAVIDTLYISKMER